MRKLLISAIIIVLIASAIGYGLNRFSEARNLKRVNAIMDAHKVQIEDMKHEADVLISEAFEAGRQAGARKVRAQELKAQREALKAPETAQETVERLHKAGFTSARILK